MCVHATGCTIAALNGGGVGFGITQALKNLMDTLLGTMCIADVHSNDSTALTVFDNLEVGQSAPDAITQLWKAASTSFSGLSIGYTENLWKQAFITGFAVGEQYPMMAIG
jgi:hypothetical protein